MRSLTSVDHAKVLGPAGNNMVRGLKGFGKGSFYLSGIMTIQDGLENGFQMHHAVDIGLQAAIYGVGASIPVAGWIIGGGYFLGDMYFQSTHDGISITQYYLDGKR